MEKIRLSRNEKKVFRMALNGIKECPSDYPSHKFVAALKILEEKGFMKVTWVSGDIPWTFTPTKKGRAYISLNPNLTNPVDWAAITGVIGVLGFIISVIALFVSCTNYITIHG